MESLTAAEQKSVAENGNGSRAKRTLLQNTQAKKRSKQTPTRSSANSSSTTSSRITYKEHEAKQAAEAHVLAAVGNSRSTRSRVAMAEEEIEEEAPNTTCDKCNKEYYSQSGTTTKCTTCREGDGSRVSSS